MTARTKRWAVLFVLSGAIFSSETLINRSHAADLRVLHDTETDGWALWTAYGPGMNETYGAGNNSKHHHDPNRILAEGNARVLEAVDLGVGEPKRYRSGCLSTREAPDGTGFFRFAHDVRSLRFAFDVTISDWNHAVWPAVWLRGVGGAGVHEIDILEGFTAQSGTNLYRIAVHSASSLGGSYNTLHDPWPGTPLLPGVRATVWAEIHRPGSLNATQAFVRAGINDTTRVNTPDPHTEKWWTDAYGWDLIVQQQIGGNWVGDPDVNPYTGTLQNGQPGKPPSEVPSWSGISSMTIHRVLVTAALDTPGVDLQMGVQGASVIAFDSWVTRTYTLEASTNLIGNQWQPAQGPRAGAGGLDAFIDTEAHPIRFYRLLEHPN